MSSVRQNKIASLLTRELSEYFRQESRTVCKGAMVTVTRVRVTPDLQLAKVYISIFGTSEPEEVLQNIRHSDKEVKHQLALKLKSQLRKMPDLNFYRDDTLDYVEDIENLLKQ